MPDLSNYSASFKDPSGFVFQADGRYYRQINQRYADDYEMLMQSGLYKALTSENMLVAHEEVAGIRAKADEYYKTILPEQVSFISYAYEWSFDQLKDAALLTLAVLQVAVEHGMSLKDATPFNIQLVKGRPIFIHRLSLEMYDAVKPWIAYRQF